MTAGDDYTLFGDFTDNYGNMYATLFNWTVNWGDGTSDGQFTSDNTSFGHIYKTAGDYSPQVTVTDSRGTYDGSTSVSVAEPDREN